MELSKRLFAVASLVTPGNKIADIGTDHAYIPIYLIEKNICVSAIAMDVNEGPIERAKDHIIEAGYENQIETRLSNGLEKLRPKEVESVIIAGMGGGLVLQILSAHPEVTCSLKECILQPQSEIAKVRAFLLNHGFEIIEEEMVLDEGKYYPMMKVLPPTSMDVQTECPWNEIELRYGKLLLEQNHPVLHAFLERELRIYEDIFRSIENKTGEKIQQRKEELQQDITCIQKGLDAYDL